MGSFLTNESNILIENLSPCVSYWVVGTAIYCFNRLSTSPQSIDLLEPKRFNLAVSLENYDTCGSWIINDFTRKISDIQNSILAALRDSSCNIIVSCVADSQFTCGNDPNIANYE